MRFWLRVLVMLTGVAVFLGLVVLRAKYFEGLCKVACAEHHGKAKFQNGVPMECECFRKR